VRADRHRPLPDDVVERWSTFGRWPDRTYFPSLVGVQLEELREDYCRMRLPFRPELEQPQGLVHGGAVREADVVAEGWVTRRGRTTAFCRAEATSEGHLVMEGSLVYAVRGPESGPR